MIEAFEAGDPSGLPVNGGSNPAAKQDSAVPDATAPATEAATPPATSDDQPRGRDGLTGAERETIRAWAVEQGIEVKTRGQLKKDLVANYQAWKERQ